MGMITERLRWENEEQDEIFNEKNRVIDVPKRKPDETGVYKHDKQLKVDVWIQCIKENYYMIWIKSKGFKKFYENFTQIYDKYPSFIIKNILKCKIQKHQYLKIIIYV